MPLSQKRDTPDRLAKKASALLEIYHAVLDDGDLNTLYRTIQGAMAECLGASGFYIALYQDGGQHVVYRRGLIPFNAGTGMAGSLPDTWINSSLAIWGSSAGVMAAELPPAACGRADGAHPFGDVQWFDAVAQYLSLALERQQARMHDRGSLPRALPLGMALVEDRIFKWVNREMVRMFGFNSETDFLDQSVEMIYGAAEAFEFAGKTIFQEITSKGKADYELELVRRDGSRFPVHVQLNSAGTTRLGRRAILASFTDMSRQREAERDNVKKERLQGALEMAGGICHEMNQPLQAIMGYSELMSMDPEFRIWETGMETIRTQASRLGEVTAGLANITRYKILECPGNKRVVDIWGAGAPKMGMEIK
ncbi:MAG: PAS domain-containing protein [Desulfobacter sp.]|nr:MAG: PAS domain-containing protein [Desulfobacter sp.]